jgi:hypothetical protein
MNWPKVLAGASAVVVGFVGVVVLIDGPPVRAMEPWTPSQILYCGLLFIGVITSGVLNFISLLKDV